MADLKSEAIQDKLMTAFVAPKPVFILPWETPTAMNHIAIPGLGTDMLTIMAPFIDQKLDNPEYAQINPLRRGYSHPFATRVGQAVAKGAKEAKFK
jgi:hypothetical protein